MSADEAEAEIQSTNGSISFSNPEEAEELEEVIQQFEQSDQKATGETESSDKADLEISANGANRLDVEICVVTILDK
ncbi:UNVERIFIED_CONTAM: hypothetical protein K2H54_009592 [Gekko kuhli]